MKIFPIFKKIIITPSDEVEYEGLVYSLPEDMPLVSDTEYAIRAGVYDELFPIPIDDNLIIAIATEFVTIPIPVVEDKLCLSSLLEMFPEPFIEDALRLEQDEIHPLQVAYEIAIVKAQEEAVHPVPVVGDDLRLEQDEIHPEQTVEDAIRLEQDEIQPIQIIEDAIRIEQDEVQDFPNAEETLTAISGEDTDFPISIDEDALRLEQDEIQSDPLTNNSVVIDLEQEIQPYAIADEKTIVNVNIEELVPIMVDTNTITGASVLDAHPEASEDEDDLHILYVAGGESFNGGVGDWNNENNALGLKDSINATISSALLGTANGDLTMDYPDFNIEADWVIEHVYLRFYFSISTTINLGANTILLRYRIGNSGPFTQLDSFTLSLIGSTNHLHDYQTYDITSAINSIADLNALESNMNASLAGPGLGNSINADAAELIVVLRKKYGTDTPTQVTLTNPEFESNYPTTPPTGWVVDSGTWAYTSGASKRAVTGHAAVTGTGTGQNDLRQRIPIGTVGAAGNEIRLEWEQTNIDGSVSNTSGAGFIFRNSALSEISNSFSQLRAANAQIPFYEFRTHTAKIPSGTDQVDIVLRANNNDAAYDHIKLWNLGGVAQQDAEFTITDANFNEGDGTVMITVNRANLGQAVSVQYETVEGTALEDDNYVATSGTLNFGANDTFKQLSVDLLDNDMSQGTRQFTVTLSNPSSGSIITDGTGVYQIADDEPPNSGYWTEGVMFGSIGSNVSMSRTGTLAGISDSSNVIFSAWFKSDEPQTNAIIDFDGLNGNPNFDVFISASGNIQMNVTNNLNAAIWTVNTSGLNLHDGEWHHILIAMQGPQTSKQLYIDDVVPSFATNSGTTDSPIAFSSNVTDIGIGQRNSGSGTPDGYMRGCLTDIYLHTTYIDIDIASNRRKFIDANGKPVYLGYYGQAPLGVVPHLFLKNPPSNFHVNRGTGGDFTQNGTLTSCHTSPDGKTFNEFADSGD